MIASHLFTQPVFIDHLVCTYICWVWVVQRLILSSCIQKISLVGDIGRKLEIKKSCDECFGYTKKNS